MNLNRKILETVALGLGELLNHFIFVGGTVVELYASVVPQTSVRPTEDVDCVVEVASLAMYYELENQLRRLGFQDDMEEDAPICRKLYRGIKVDIMPTDEKILKFTNRWYKTGFLKAQNYQLSSAVTIKILPVEYFIASKLEAFFSPHRKYGLDLYASHDFEDIVFILDNDLEVITSINNSNILVKTYIATQFKVILQQKSFVYALSGILRDEDNEMRLAKIFKTISLLK